MLPVNWERKLILAALNIILHNSILSYDSVKRYIYNKPGDFCPEKPCQCEKNTDNLLFLIKLACLEMLLFYLVSNKGLGS